jgi:MFS family permease
MRLPRKIFQLGLISFFGDLSSEMLYPITPVFLTTVLGASMTSLGLIEGTAEAVASIMKIYSGVWSDRIQKRKPFIILGYVFASISKPMIGLSHSWTQVWFARNFDRVGKGLRTAPRDALISESVPFEQRGHAFGIHRAMDTSGATLGPLIALVYLHFYQDSLRWIYLLAFIPGLISVMLAMLIQEQKDLPKDISNVPRLQIPWKHLPSQFRNYLLAWTLFSLVNSSDVFLLMRVRDAGVSLTNTILLYVFYNFLYAMMSPYFGRKSDHLPRKNVIIFGMFIFSFVYAGFSVASEIWQFTLLFGLYGIYMAATEGVGKALAIDLFPPEQKATAVGILGVTSGVSMVIASFLAGYLWDQYGAPSTFLVSAVGSLMSASWLLWMLNDSTSRP